MDRYAIGSRQSRSCLCLAVAALLCQGLLWPSGAVANQPASKISNLKSQISDLTGSWKAAVVSTVITPEEPMWMSGYASRDKPSQGKIHDLNAKVLALQDQQGTRLVIVTVDLLGIPRATRDWLEAQVAQRYNLGPQALLLSASHTHSGPVVREAQYSIYGNTLYGLSPEQIQQSNKYV